MKRINYLPLVLLLLTIVIFFKPYIFQGKIPVPADTIVGLYHPFRDYFANEYPNGIPYKNFLITDPVRQQYPWRFLSIETFKNYTLPLWNPYTMSGTPLLANVQNAALYPLNLVFLVLPFEHGWYLLIFLQQILAGAFMYLYLLHLRLNRYACFLGAISYSFSGFMIAWLEWGTIGHTILWLPLILLSIDKLFFAFKKQVLSRRLSLWSAVFIISLTSALFAGHLQTFVYLFLVAFLYIIARWILYKKPIKSLLYILGLILCFLILTAIQWIPALQFISESARSIDQVDWNKEGWFIPWEHLIQFIAPDFFW